MEISLASADAAHLMTAIVTKLVFRKDYEDDLR